MVSESITPCNKKKLIVCEIIKSLCLRNRHLDNMAAGGIELAGNDPVTDQLLSHMSDHVISETRKKFATGPLGLSLTQYGHIEEDERYAANRNIEVSKI